MPEMRYLFFCAPIEGKQATFGALEFCTFRFLITGYLSCFFGWDFFIVQPNTATMV